MNLIRTGFFVGVGLFIYVNTNTYAMDPLSDTLAKEKIRTVLLVNQREMDAALPEQFPPQDALKAIGSREKRINDAARAIAKTVNESPSLQSYLIQEVDRQSDRTIRQQLVQAMGVIQGAWATDFLITKLDDEPVNLSAATALGELGGAKAVAALKNVLTEKLNLSFRYDFFMRRDAVMALIKCGSPAEIIPTLREVIREDTDATTVRHAAEKLGLCKVKEAIPELVDVALTREFRGDYLDGYSVRVSAMKGLSNIPGPEASAALERIVSEIPNLVPARVGRTLKSLGEKFLNDQRILSP
jgi:HEAT repeat protein